MGSIGDYVFDVVSVIWVIYVGVVMGFCFVFYVGCVDCDFMGFFFWGFVDVVIGYEGCIICVC